MGIRRLAPLAVVALVLGFTTGTSPAQAVPPPVAWPGGSAVSTVDNANQFGSNLSGLAYEGSGPGAVMWAVRNGPSTLFKLVRSGNLWVPAPGEWASGKNLTFSGAAGAPDSEGVTFTDEGSAGGVFISSERRLNAAPSRPEIIRYDVGAAGATLASTGIWDLTADLPVVGANAGPEAITWVPDSYLVGKGLVDQSTGAAYSPASYPNHGRGLFFVGLEANGSVYAYALDLTGSTYTRVATFASSLAGVMDLSFETEKQRLWAVCDDTCQGRTATFDIVGGAFDVTAVYERPAGMPNYNNEGFTITPQSECVAGAKPVFWADDSTRPNVLRTGTLSCTVPDPCLGLLPTITGAGYILGTPGDDVILGSSGADTIRAGGGNDTVCGGGGADELRGEGGNDVLDGQGGADLLDGGADADTADYSARTAALKVSTTGAGDDGEAGEGDTVTGIESVRGGSGADELTGSAAAETLLGGGGADTLTGGDGPDSVQGGPGDDKLLEGATASGADVLDGGADADAVFYSSRTAAVTVTTTGAGDDGGVGEGDTVTGIETVRGGSGNDYLTGSSAAETFVGGAGADTITGGAGVDEIHGGAGNDRLVEGSSTSGADLLDGGADVDTVNYSARTAAVKVSTTGSGNDGQTGEGDTVAAVEIVRAGSGNDSLAGSTAAETFYGGPGADRISGGTGSDVLRGEAGADELLAADGINGNDTVDGGADADTATADPGDVVTNVP